MRKRHSWRKNKGSSLNKRLDIFGYVIVFFAGLVLLKLVWIQLINGPYYQSLASNQHEMEQLLLPERGQILIHDLKDGKLIPIADNEHRGLIYAEPSRIKQPYKTAEDLAKILHFDDEELELLKQKLDKPNDPYEPVAKDVDQETLDLIDEANIQGVRYIRELKRYYPEPFLSGQITGFVGSNEEGSFSGKYGLEGYFNKELAGKQGSFLYERDVVGRVIAVGEHQLTNKQDGSDLVLTLDRTIQFSACNMLDEAVKKHSADSGSVVVVEPKTGRVLAMCGAPNYDSNNYSEVENISLFNIPGIFESYEPGSIFKPLTMAAAIDAGAVTPTTTFVDTGSVMVDGWHKPIGNAEGKVYGEVNMTQVLEESINTGMIFSMREMGMDPFVEYVKRFGFGEYTGIQIMGENPGTINSLDIGSEIYAATATFGQGITATPIQLAMAYASLANGGVLKTPTIIDEIRHPDGSTEKMMSQDIAQVISEKTASTIGAMLVSVIEHGHGKRAGVPGYYIAGKTGTAQVAKSEGIGYSEDSTIGSFAGFGPVEDPKFAMVVRIDNPKDVVWAESTAAPLFGEISSFLLQYFEIAPVRSIE